MAKGTEWIDSWAGGRYYRNTRSRDRLVFVIERAHLGRRYSIPLPHVANEKDAEAELALFWRDPPGFHAKYVTSKAPPPEALRIDDDTSQEVLDALEAAGREESYRKEVRRYLVQWGNALKGRPIATVKPAELKVLLDTWKSRNHRLAALKSFCSHFVSEDGGHRLPPGENPAALLEIKKPPKSKKAKKRKDYPIAVVERHYRALDTQESRDVLVLRAMAGMHGSEISRVARGGGQLKKVDGQGTVIVGTLTFMHKSGIEHRVSLDAQMYAAAERLTDDKYAPGKETMARAVRRAAKKLEAESENDEEVEHLLPGRLRHSFITWARTKGVKVTVGGVGVDLREVQQVVGHRSGTNTTRDHYLNEEIPPLIRLPLQLQHPDDPPYDSDPKPANVHRLPSAVA